MSHVEPGPERPRAERATDPSDPQGARRSGRHPVNVGHLVMGVAFLGLVVVWGLVTSDTVQLHESGWVLGLPWLVAGALGLLASVLRGPRDLAGTPPPGTPGQDGGWN